MASLKFTVFSGYSRAKSNFYKYLWKRGYYKFTRTHKQVYGVQEICISVSYQEKIFSVQWEVSGKFCTENTTGKQIVSTVFEGTLLINLCSYCYSVSIIVDVIEEVTKSFDFYRSCNKHCCTIELLPRCIILFHFESCTIERKKIKLIYSKIFKCKFILLF